MAKNGSKNGVTLDLQEKEGLDHLKTRASIETANIKVGLWAAREGGKYWSRRDLKWWILK